MKRAIAEALGIDAGLLDDLGAGAEERMLGPAETLFERGDPVDGVFVVLDGSVKVIGYDGQQLAVLGKGSVVGEVAALAGGTRTATVEAAELTRVAAIDSDGFEQLVAAAPELYERVATEAVRRLDHKWLMEFIHWLLGPVDPQVGDAISQWVTWRRLKAGEYLYRAGEQAEGGFTVIRGRIRVARDTADDTDPDGYDVGKGSLLGEEGLVADVPRPRSALAVRDSVVVEVPRAAFLALLEAQPKVVASVLANLMRQQASRKRSVRESVTAIVSYDVATRDDTCRQLLREFEGFGRTKVVSSDSTDETLDKPGVAQSRAGTPGDVRVSQLLHELEHEADYVLYAADIESTPWTRRVVRQADIVLVVVPADAAESALPAVDALIEGRSLGRLILAVIHPPHQLRPRGTSQLVSRWNPDLVVHVRRQGEPGYPRLARILADRATGLVLGGGGARGFAHLGVWRALQQLGVEVDLIGGASMGAAMAAAIARGGTVEEIEEEVFRAFDGVFDYTIPLVALVKGKRVARRLTTAVGDWDIEDLWMPYYCTSTNLTHSRVVVHDRGDLVHAVRASVAIPGVLPPVSSRSDLLVDSGVLNNLPADVMRRRMPNGGLIAVDVAPPVGPRARHDLGLWVSPMQVLASKVLRRKRRFPQLRSVLLRSMITASMRERDRNVRSGVIDLYLDLDMRGIGLLDFDRAEKVVRAGYEASIDRVEAWLEASRNE